MVGWLVTDHQVSGIDSGGHLLTLVFLRAWSVGYLVRPTDVQHYQFTDGLVIGILILWVFMPLG